MCLCAQSIKNAIISNPVPLLHLFLSLFPILTKIVMGSLFSISNTAPSVPDYFNLCGGCALGVCTRGGMRPFVFLYIVLFD